MIRVVAFDIGRVLLDFDYGIFVRRMAPRTRLDVSALDALLNQSPLLAAYESGQIDCAKFFRKIQADTGFNGTQEEFSALFEEIFTPIDAMMELHAQVVACGIPAWTFSNTNAMAVRHISRAYEFWARCAGHILSHEVGALKPDAAIYTTLESTTEATGYDIAYIDDLQDNVDAALKRGWSAVRYENPGQARVAFRKMGIAV